MISIAALALNPAVDLSFSVDALRPVHKVRGTDERHDPGGGAINVARVFVRQGGMLVNAEGMQRRTAIPVAVASAAGRATVFWRR